MLNPQLLKELQEHPVFLEYVRHGGYLGSLYEYGYSIDATTKPPSRRNAISWCLHTRHRVEDILSAYTKDEFTYVGRSIFKKTLMFPVGVKVELMFMGGWNRGPVFILPHEGELTMLEPGYSDDEFFSRAFQGQPCIPTR